MLMKKAKSTLSSVLLVCLSLIWLSPIYIILANSFKSRDEMYVNPLGMPVRFSLEYYSGAMEKMNFLRAFGVSFVITHCQCRNYRGVVCDGCMDDGSL